MDATELHQLVKDGRFFSCEFVKRTDGTVRRMLARVGVHSSGKGELPYDPVKHDLVVVWDVLKRGFRTIPADNLRRIRHHGKTIHLVRE